MIIPSYKIVKPITTMIILNHGITDIIHARTFHLFRPLIRVNLLSVFGVYIAPTQLIIPVFLGLSVIHFHRDFPPFSKVFQMSSSVLLVASLFKTPYLLFYYMLGLHIPNHFRMSWRYCKYFPVETFVLLFLSGCFIDFITPFILSIRYFKLVISVVIGHILYHEVYVNRGIILKK
jgi:hypothetical protein